MAPVLIAVAPRLPFTPVTVSVVAFWPDGRTWVINIPTDWSPLVFSGNDCVWVVTFCPPASIVKVEHWASASLDLFVWPPNTVGSFTARAVITVTDLSAAEMLCPADYVAPSGT